ncbi:MAG: dihydrodipicolinate synthase family protein [Thermaerobacter sp.]|nr:dihydrodipicolinate synthase family protein [Thermaerobacter sp.]
MEGPATMPALLTPFDRAGRLDVSRYPDYLGWLEAAGVDGHFAFGTTGEGITLSVDERRHGLEAIIRASGVPVYVQVASLNLSDTQTLMAHAADAGAAGAAIVSPSYYTHDADALVAYYVELAREAPLPLLWYNIPTHAPSDLTPAVAERLLAETDAYVGIKDSSRDATRLSLYRDLGLRTYTGAESLVLYATAIGAGSITGLASAFPELVVAATRDALTPAGAPRQRQVIQTRERLKGPYIQCLREAARLSGMDLGPPRAPFRPLTAGEQADVAHAVQLGGRADQRTSPPGHAGRP